MPKLPLHAAMPSARVTGRDIQQGFVRITSVADSREITILCCNRARRWTGQETGCEEIGIPVGPVERWSGLI